MKSKITKIQEILTKGIAIALVGMFSFTPIAFAATSLDDSYLEGSFLDKILYGTIGSTAKEIEEYLVGHSTLYISNEIQLRALAEYVNSGKGEGKGCQGKEIRLLNDIIVDSSQEWVPIGNISHPFKGTFDGKGYTISGIKFNRNHKSYSELSNVGLFGYIENATIKNITLSNSKFNIPYYYSDLNWISDTNYDFRYTRVGGIVGYNVESIIENCKIDSNVVIKGLRAVGGIAGGNYKGKIKNCENRANINGCVDVGGIVGATVGDVEVKDGEVKVTDGEVKVIDFCKTNYAKVIGCTNKGNVYAEFKEAGGISGRLTDNAIIQKCINEGKITTEERLIQRIINGGTVTVYPQNIGGIAGYVTGGGYGIKDKCVAIDGCINKSELIAGYQDAGGIAGQLGGEGGGSAILINCINYSNNIYTTKDKTTTEHKYEVAGFLAGDTASRGLDAQSGTNDETEINDDPKVWAYYNINFAKCKYEKANEEDTYYFEKDDKYYANVEFTGVWTDDFASGENDEENGRFYFEQVKTDIKDINVNNYKAICTETTSDSKRNAYANELVKISDGMFEQIQPVTKSNEEYYHYIKKNEIHLYQNENIYEKKDDKTIGFVSTEGVNINNTVKIDNTTDKTVTFNIYKNDESNEITNNVTEYCKKDEQIIIKATFNRLLADENGSRLVDPKNTQIKINQKSIYGESIEKNENTTTIKYTYTVKDGDSFEINTLKISPKEDTDIYFVEESTTIANAKNDQWKQEIDLNTNKILIDAVAPSVDIKASVENALETNRYTAGKEIIFEIKTSERIDAIKTLNAPIMRLSFSKSGIGKYNYIDEEKGAGYAKCIDAKIDLDGLTTWKYSYIIQEGDEGYINLESLEGVISDESGNEQNLNIYNKITFTDTEIAGSKWPKDVNVTYSIVPQGDNSIQIEATFDKVLYVLAGKVNDKSYTRTLNDDYIDRAPSLTVKDTSTGAEVVAGKTGIELIDSNTKTKITYLVNNKSAIKFNQLILTNNNNNKVININGKDVDPEGKLGYDTENKTITIVSPEGTAKVINSGASLTTTLHNYQTNVDGMIDMGNIYADTTRPTVSISTNVGGDAINETEVEYTFKWSEQVKDFTAEDITVVDGAKKGALVPDSNNVTNTVYTMKVDYTSVVANENRAEVRLVIEDGVCKDLSEKDNIKQENYIIIDKSKPTIESYEVEKIDEKMKITVTYTAEIATDDSYIIVEKDGEVIKENTGEEKRTTGTIDADNKKVIRYEVDDPNTDNTATIKVFVKGTVIDTIGNKSYDLNKDVYNDAKPPEVTSINVYNITDLGNEKKVESKTNASILKFEINWSKYVKDFNKEDIEIKQGNSTLDALEFTEAEKDTKTKDYYKKYYVKVQLQPNSTDNLVFKVKAQSCTDKLESSNLDEKTKEIEIDNAAPILENYAIQEDKSNKQIIVEAIFNEEIGNTSYKVEESGTVNSPLKIQFKEEEKDAISGKGEYPEPKIEGNKITYIYNISEADGGDLIATLGGQVFDTAGNSTNLNTNVENNIHVIKSAIKDNDNNLYKFAKVVGKTEETITDLSIRTYFKAGDKLKMNDSIYTIPNENVETNENGKITSIDDINVEEANLYIDMKAPTISTEVYANEPNEKNIYSKDEIINIKVVASEKVQEPESTIPQLKISFSQSGLGKYNYQGEKATTGNAKIDNVTEEEGKTVWNYIYKIADGDEGTINVKYLDTTIKDLAGNEQNIKNINMPEANSGNDITSLVDTNEGKITYSIYKKDKEDKEDKKITDFSSVTTFANGDIIKIVVNYPKKLYTSWGSSNVDLDNDNSPKLALYSGNTTIVEDLKGVLTNNNEITYSYTVTEKEQITQITQLVQTYGTKVYIGTTTTAYSKNSKQELSLENHNLYINTLGTAINTNGIKADTVDPTVKITHKRVRDESGKVKENEYQYTFKWSEEVVGFTVDSITAKNGVKGDLSEVTENDDGTYSYTINISKANSSKDITIIVERGVCKDLAGHKNIRAEYDTANMNLNRIELDNGDYYTFAKVTTDEDETVEEIKSFEKPNYFISGDVIRVIKNGETNYNYTVEKSVNAEQQLTITINDSDNSVEYKNNTEGEINIAEANIYFDTIAPTISTIAYAENERDINYYTSGEKIIIEATASEELKNTEAPDLYVKFGEGNEQLAQKDSTIVEENNTMKWYYSYIIKNGDNGKISISYDEQAVIEDLAGNTTKLDIYSQTSEGQSTQGVTATIAGHKMSNNDEKNIDITYKITNSKTYITEGNLKVEVNIPYFIYTGYMNGIENGVNKNYANLLTDTENAPKLYVECGGKYYSDEGYTATSISHDKDAAILGKQQLQCDDVITTLTYQIPVTDFNCSGVTQLTKMKISIPNNIYMSQRYISRFAADETGTNELYDVSKFKEITYGVSSSQNVGECNITELEKYIDKNKISEKFDIGDIYADTIAPSIEIKAEKINDDNEITQINNDITNASRIKYTFTASEEVTFNKNTIKLQNGTISGDLEGPITQEDGRYEYTMIVSINVANGNIGNVMLELQQGALTDRAGNVSSEAKKETRIDKKAPILQSLTVYSQTDADKEEYKVEDEIKIVATLDENITTLTEEQLPSLTIKFSSNKETKVLNNPEVNGNQIVYTYEIAKGDNGELLITKFKGTVVDVAGNSLELANIALNGDKIIANTTMPTLEKITVTKPGFDYETLNNEDTERYGVGKTITVKAEFNENIENTTEVPQLKFEFVTATETEKEKEIDGVINNNIITYTYKIENGDNGEFIITGLDGTVIDRANNSTDLSEITELKIEDFEPINADTTAPKVSFSVSATNEEGKTNLGIKPQGNNYKAGTKLTITATIDEYVYKKDSEERLSKFTKDTAPDLNVKFGTATTSKQATCKEVTYEDNKTIITYEYVIINGQNGNMQLKIEESQYYDIALNSNSDVDPTNTTVIADTVKPTSNINYQNGYYNITFNENIYYMNNGILENATKSNVPKLEVGSSKISASEINNKTNTIKYASNTYDSNATLEGSQLCDAAGNFYKGGKDPDIPEQPVEPDNPTDNVAPYIEEIKAYTNYGTDQQKEVTGNTTKETIITYEIKWSEPVKNFDKNDITIFNGSIQKFEEKEDGSEYIVTVYSPIEGKCPILIPEGICTDVAGNANEQRVTYNQVVIDYTKPEVRAKVNGGNYVIDTDKKKSTLKETIVVNEEVSKFEYIWSKSTELPTEGFITINPDEIQINSDIKLEKPVEEIGTYYLYMKVTDLAGNDFVGRTSGFEVKNSNITLTPSTNEPTDQDVTVAVSYGEGLTENRKAGIQGKTNSADPTIVIASENGTVYAEATDIAGNKVYATLEVNNIDKTSPEATIEYTTNGNGSVTAKISFNEEAVITNNNGKNAYVFTKNGEFTFEFKDLAGNTGTAVAKVTTIKEQDEPVSPPVEEDKTAPEITFNYTTTAATVGTTIGATITSNEDAIISYSWDNQTWSSSEDYVRSQKVVKTPKTAGTYKLYAKAIDKASKTSSVYTLEFTVVKSDEDIVRPEIIFEDLTTIQKDGVKYVKVNPTFTTDELTSKMDKDALGDNKVSYNKLTSDNKLKTGSEITVEGTTTKYIVIVNGDVNCDGKVGPIDVTMANSIRLNKAKVDPIQELAADFDSSGYVSAIDITMINSYRLGKIKGI